MRSPLRGSWLAVGVLALGAASCAAVFTVASQVLLHDHGMQQPGELYLLWEQDPKHAAHDIELSWHAFEQSRERSRAWADLASVSSVNLDFSLADGAEPVQVEGVAVSSNYFRLLGARALLGRTLEPADDDPRAPVHAVMSERLWRSRYHGDRSVIGRSLRVSGGPVTIVGVMPGDFDFPRGVDLWVAQGNRLAPFAQIRVLKGVGRLRPGQTAASGAADLERIIRELDPQYPASSRGYKPRLVPMKEALFGRGHVALWLALAAAGVLLLITAANAANLMLARAAGQQRDYAIRTALGAGAGQLAAHLARASLVPGLLGAAVGCGLAWFALPRVMAWAPADIPRLSTVTPEPVPFALAAAVTVGAALLAGLLPLGMLRRLDLVRSLKEESAQNSGSKAVHRRRQVLIAAEAALVMLLLAGAGLLVRTAARLDAIDPGFRPSRVLTFRVTLGPSRAQQDQRRAFYRDVLARVRALPGVESAGAVLIRPLGGTVGWDLPYTVEGQTAVNPAANYEAISAGYFATLGIGLAAGRDFDDRDTHEKAPVVLVSESLARRHWGRVDQAVGRRLKLGPPDGPQPWATVIGVARDVRYREWRTAREDVYVPYLQRAQHRSDFVLRTRQAPEALIPAVRAAVLGLDPAQAISSVTTMESLVGETLAQPRFNGLLMTAFALVALALAAAGVCGVVSRVAEQKRGEIAIRLALGLRPSRALGLTLAEGVLPVGAGVGVGLAAAPLLSRLAEPLLFGVTPGDPWSLAGAAALLLAVAGFACFAPAWRVARLDPAVALRRS